MPESHPVPARTPQAAPGAMSGSYDESAAAAEETTDSFWEVSPSHALLPWGPHCHQCSQGGPGWQGKVLPAGIPAMVAWASKSVLAGALTLGCPQGVQSNRRDQKELGLSSPKAKAPSLNPQSAWCHLHPHCRPTGAEPGSVGTAPMPVCPRPPPRWGTTSAQ